ncbi:cytochrome C biogenesis protein CcdA [Desulfuromonas versatilis]|uniref:Cytochrome C biogenesis protein CcdA n=1 Tax=Desulfuromonas versatilis TaxID=2802975 RepID=A0ABN6DUQ3_9BACT|nr:cytochrome c biogenesis protein CcdA [Desulfuromonas versatilis]BCR03711.1 cytochrome C biogenesis protein CcdA [Desulfuromonas versatilis]
MIETLLGQLSQAVSGAPLVALAAAAGWGILSIVLSPCHLASIPLVVGFIEGQETMTTRRAFVIANLFAFGILMSIALIGLLTALAGRMLGDLGPWGNWLVAGIFFLFGLHLLGAFPMPWPGLGQVGTQRKGLLAALILGLVFGVALGPCTFAFMGPVLGVAFAAAGSNLLYATFLLLAYGFGHCAVIVFAGTFTEKVQQYLNWNERSQGTLWIKRVCGLLVMAGGVWLIYSAP